VCTIVSELIKSPLHKIRLRFREVSDSPGTEPRADRSPRAGSPRGVVDATGTKAQLWFIRENYLRLKTRGVTSRLAPLSARYRSRFCTAALVGAPYFYVAYRDRELAIIARLILRRTRLPRPISANLKFKVSVSPREE